MLSEVRQRFIKDIHSKSGMTDSKGSEARRRKLPIPPTQSYVEVCQPCGKAGHSGTENQVRGPTENKQELLSYKGDKATIVVEENKAAVSVTEEIVNKLKETDLKSQTNARKKSMASTLKDKSKNVLNEWNSLRLSNKMHASEKPSRSSHTSSYDETEKWNSVNDQEHHARGILRKIEIKKIPGQSLGFFIRKGNGLDRKDGVFISRVSLGSVLDEMGLLHAGDEVLEVNEVKTTGFSLEDVALMMQIPDKLILTTNTAASMRGKRMPHKNCKNDIKPSEPRETDLTTLDKEGIDFPSKQNHYNSGDASGHKQKRSNPVPVNPELVRLRNHHRLANRRRSHSDGDQVELANALDLLLLKNMDATERKIAPPVDVSRNKLSVSHSTPVSSLGTDQSQIKAIRAIAPKSPKFLRKLPLPPGLKKTKSKDNVVEDTAVSSKEKKSKKNSSESNHTQTVERNSKLKSSKTDYSLSNFRERKQEALGEALTKDAYDPPNHTSSFSMSDGSATKKSSLSKDYLSTDSSDAAVNGKYDLTSSSSGLGFTRAQRYIRKASSSQNLAEPEETVETEQPQKTPRTRRSSVNTPPNFKSSMTKKISVPNLMQPFNTLRRKLSEAPLPKFIPQIDINCNDTTDSGVPSPQPVGSVSVSSPVDDDAYTEYDGETPDPHFRPTRGYSGMLSVHIVRADNIPVNEKAKRCYCSIDIDDDFQAITSRKEFKSLAEFDESFEIEMSQACEMTVYLFAEMKQIGPEELTSSAKIMLEKLLKFRSHHKVKLRMESGVTLFLWFDYTEAVKLLKRTPSRLHRGVFGFNLVATLDEEENTIPLIVRKCVEEIELRGLSNVGIYRISGNARKKRLLKAEFDRNSASVDVSTEAGIDCNILSGILKDYLRELPEPLISEDMYRSLLSTRLKIQSPDLNTRQGLLSRLINLIPYSNRGTLIYIMDHLVKVADLKDKNKMDISNLAVCFGPVLMCSSAISSTPQGVLDFKDQIAALEYLLNIWPKSHERGEEVEITFL